MGVRIEDDIAIVDGTVENLTRSCPKTVLEVERVCQSKSSLGPSFDITL